MKCTSIILIVLICFQSTFSKLPSLLIKIPTRSRPTQFFAMLDLYYQKLSKQLPYTFLITCDIDDEQMNNPTVIKRLQLYPHLKFTFSKNESKVEAYNKDLNSIDFDIVLITSDDMKPIVQDYDKIIVQTMLKHFPHLDGTLNFNDGHLTNQCNTMPIIGKKYYNKFGYAYNPSYKSLWCDAEFSAIARILRKEKTFNDVIIQHDHTHFSHATLDDLYIKNNQYFQSDRKVFFERIKRFFDINESDLWATSSKLWSILICCTQDNKSWLEDILPMLHNQIKKLNLEREIEIMIDSSTYERSHKRNKLAQDALGKYHNFIDPGMHITEDYIVSIYSLLKSNPDAVILSRKPTDEIPLHMCPIKRCIRLLFTFLEKYPRAEKHWEKMIKESSVITSVRYPQQQIMTLENNVVKTNGSDELQQESHFVYSLPISLIAYGSNAILENYNSICGGLRCN